MTKEVLNKAIHLKGEIKKLKKYIDELPKMKSKYTDLEYRTRKEYYENSYADWTTTLSELKHKLTITERMILVMK